MTNTSLHITKHWYAIYTRFRSEKLVVKLLERKGIVSYLPLRSVVKRYTRKIRKYEVPLINCYVFVCIPPEEKGKVLETEHVLRFIKPGKEIIPIPEYEIDILKRVTGDLGVDVSVRQTQLTPGDVVEVKAGALMGLKGKIVGSANKNSFVVDLQHLGLQLQIHIEHKMLSKVATMA